MVPFGARLLHRGIGIFGAYDSIVEIPGPALVRLPSKGCGAIDWLRINMPLITIEQKILAVWSQYLRHSGAASALPNAALHDTTRCPYSCCEREICNVFVTA